MRSAGGVYLSARGRNEKLVMLMWESQSAGLGMRDSDQRKVYGTRNLGRSWHPHKGLI